MTVCPQWAKYYSELSELKFNLSNFSSTYSQWSINTFHKYNSHGIIYTFSNIRKNKD